MLNSAGGAAAYVSGIGPQKAPAVCTPTFLCAVLTVPDTSSWAGIDATASVPNEVKEVQFCEHHQSYLMPPPPPKQNRRHTQKRVQ